MDFKTDRVFMDMAQGVKNAVTKVRLKSQLVEDTAERYGLSINDNVEELMRECYKKELSKEYLVHGAILTCTNCTNKDVTVCVDGKNFVYHAKKNSDIRAEYINEYDEQKVYGKLEVEENFDASVEGRAYATTQDCVVNKNIPYFGNCLSNPYSIEEKLVFRNNHLEGKENKSACAEGSCKYLMKLNEGWENYDIDVDFFSFVDDECGRVSGITMTSMLFCRHGGFIYPVTSGQRIEEIVQYVNAEQLNDLQWVNVTPWMVAELNRVLCKYDITTTERIRHFLAQCMKETNKGSWLREGEYKQWNSQQEYEDYFNNNTKYKYLYRGAGYIQMTWDYSYLAFATYMIKQESGISEIVWKSPANEAEGFEERYKIAVEKAEAAGMNVDSFKKIVSEGADYVAEEFAWEAAGYDWYVKGLNSIVDGLVPGKKGEADAVTSVVNRYTPQDSYADRRDYYEETIEVIK